ncbi:MAG TPA: methylated-DNA--[protein]-cysteine S-methyltransferase [Solirubrobacteraceae bacterium]|jgi:methylated-DNA-[protein]-cysteine S-methyltransferase
MRATAASQTILATTMQSPIGELTITSVDGLLTGVHMHEQRHRPQPPAGYRSDDGALTHVVTQLNAYFAGELTDFELPIEMNGTDFQRRVWAALCEIPYGETISYGELARWVGNPKASRAVGLANGRNPVAIVVPCHRVIGADGSLTGYGGGLDRKVWLLEHEAARRPGAQVKLDLGAQVA